MIELSEALAARGDASPAAAASRWRFPAAAYAGVLQWLEWNPAFRCRVEPVPLWVLRRLPAFADGASQVRAKAQLLLYQWLQ